MPQDIRAEFADMAERAAQEISALRTLVNQLQPMARGFEMIDTILRMGQPQQGFGQDFSAVLNTRAQELRNELAAEPEEKPVS